MPRESSQGEMISSESQQDYTQDESGVARVDKCSQSKCSQRGLQGGKEVVGSVDPVLDNTVVERIRTAEKFTGGGCKCSPFKRPVDPPANSDSDVPLARFALLRLCCRLLLRVSI